LAATTGRCRRSTSIARRSHESAAGPPVGAEYECCRNAGLYVSTEFPTVSHRSLRRNSSPSNFTVGTCLNGHRGDRPQLAAALGYEGATKRTRPTRQVAMLESLVKIESVSDVRRYCRPPRLMIS
jgi:hypothetical protein